MKRNSLAALIKIRPDPGGEEGDGGPSHHSFYFFEFYLLLFFSLLLSFFFSSSLLLGIFIILFRTIRLIISFVEKQKSILIYLVV